MTLKLILYFWAQLLHMPVADIFLFVGIEFV